MEREETNTAIVERFSKDLVICRYKSGARVNAIAITENLDARLRFRGKEPYAVMVVFPEDVDLHMPLFEKNYYTDIALNEITQVLALVVEGSLYAPIAQLYLKLHPTSFASRVFASEPAALSWIEERIKGRKRGR